MYGESSEAGSHTGAGRLVSGTVCAEASSENEFDTRIPAENTARRPAAKAPRLLTLIVLTLSFGLVGNTGGDHQGGQDRLIPADASRDLFDYLSRNRVARSRSRLKADMMSCLSISGVMFLLFI